MPNVSKNLIIRENNLGEKTYEIYTYIPDEKKYKDSKIKSYWGYTLIFDVKENFLRGFVVKDNKISSKISKSKAQKALKVNCEGWDEVITWQEPLEGEAGIILHTLTINHPGDCGNNNDELYYDSRLATRYWWKTKHELYSKYASICANYV